MSETSIRVDIISDVVCPWCVIGFYQLQKASGVTGLAVEIHWHPFELNPEMAEAGENLRAHLAAKYGTTREGSIKSRARLTALGEALGFAFNYADDMRMVNTFRAHQLVDWAKDYGKAHDAQLALFGAFFTRREDLNDPEVLVGVAAEIGLDPEEARRVVATGARAKAVRDHQLIWTSRGVTGVPAMVFDRQHLVTGAQGEETYARILRHVATERAEARGA
ncbi:DsbA family oxidoreductase [Dinoroseobacter sp. S76]|uniref:DsbA family oxidoreductase n=1 Tax=Dinoroseobacter sp. S76 TaxID=3415124 RepID=UPI003C7DB43A